MSTDGGSQGEKGNEVEFPDRFHTREFALDPYTWYRENLRRDRISYDERGGYWNVFGYDAAVEVLTDPDRYSSRALGEGGVLFEHTMLSMDPPEHTERRGTVAEYFHPQEVDEHKATVERRVDELLDEALEDGEFDAVADLAYKLPIMTICDILGVPRDEWRRFKQLSDTAVAGPISTGGDVEALEETRQQTVLESGRALHEQLMRKREEPEDDLISNVLEKDHGLSEYELLRMLGLLMAAGNVTTTNLIGNAVWTLLEHPDELEKLRDNPERTGDVVEEVLRYRSPVQFTGRLTTEETTLAGENVDPDEHVIVWLAAANRDPEIFDEPDEFEPGREPNNHIAFGRGPHTCLGASLARMEAEVAVRRLVEQTESWSKVDEPLQPFESTFLYGVQNLPMEVEL